MYNVYPILKNLIELKCYPVDTAVAYVLAWYDKGHLPKKDAQELILLIEKVYNVKLVNKKDEESK